ncbi:MAG: hypothetical protein QXR87_06610 [Candidatus Hadarchaeales archaeon]
MKEFGLDTGLLIVLLWLFLFLWLPLSQRDLLTFSSSSRFFPSSSRWGEG